jgi:hypothetical protein
MLYTTTNLQIGATLDFASRMQKAGYNIFWHAVGVLDPSTAEGEPLGTITLVRDFPANPTYVVGLKSESPAEHEVVVPAFTVQVLSPRKLQRLGIGNPLFFRERVVQIDGLVANQFQHRELADLIYSEYDKDKVFISVTDDAGDALEPVRVPMVRVVRTEAIDQDESIRYYIRAVLVLSYVE